MWALGILAFEMLFGEVPLGHYISNENCIRSAEEMNQELIEMVSTLFYVVVIRDFFCSLLKILYALN